MNYPIDRSRRKFIRIAGTGLLLGPLSPRLASAKMNRFARRPNPAFKPDVEIELTARKARDGILSGSATDVWKYKGRVLKGDRHSVEQIRSSYLGPIFRLEKGQKVRIFFHNEIPEMCVTHWHGLHVPADMDGHPMHAVQNGETLVYEFEILNRAGTYWFHPHTHDLTATQVYAGLAGLFIVSDPEEKALNLPDGEFDVPLVLQDRSFDQQNQFRYITHPMQTMTGFLGDRILVNGHPDFVLDAAARSYRLRLLNGSNSRIYKLAWHDGTPLTVIGNDGGLLEKPVIRDYVMLAPGERIELWADFSGHRKGSEMVLRSLEFAASKHGMHGGMGGHGKGRMMRGGMGRRGGMGGMGGMGHGMMQGALPLGSDYAIMKVRIIRNAADNSTLPPQLSQIAKLSIANAANPTDPRPIALSMAHMSPQINGRSYEMHNVLDIERVPVNSLQLFDIYHAHKGGMGMMMAMPHPIHLHGQQFRVVGRSIDPARSAEYATVSGGYVDNGWKDTVLVMPGESVRILKPFDDFPGRFMYHCHNLEHEDAGMMRDFLVE